MALNGWAFGLAMATGALVGFADHPEARMTNIDPAVTQIALGTRTLAIDRGHRGRDWTCREGRIAGPDHTP